uniref:Uncharacterized protein n=1 Tax=Arundo donax TaxID=35708 RepID=A0A0A9AT07_ARUDO
MQWSVIRSPAQPSDVSPT